MTRSKSPRPLAASTVLRPTTTEKTMPRLLRSSIERTLYETRPGERPAGGDVDIVMDGQIVFCHSMQLQRA